MALIILLGIVRFLKFFIKLIDIHPIMPSKKIVKRISNISMCSVSRQRFLGKTPRGKNSLAKLNG